MFNDGYLPRGGEQHATVVEFIDERLGEKYSNQVRLFDQMRRKRHKIIYEVAGLISTKECRTSCKFCQKICGRDNSNSYWTEKIRILRGINPRT